MDNLGPLDSEVARQISGHDLISLDVFDTLILRTVARPTDVFALVKLQLMTRPEVLLNPESLDCFPSLRVAAERQARIVKQKEQGTTEVTLDEIYTQLATLAAAEPRWLAVLKQSELDLEMRVAYPNPAARRIWSAAVQQHKKVVFCSDMYLPSTFVAKLLEKCGYTTYDGLYVSCEHAKSKHEGTFYSLIADQYGVAPNRILHVGDNEHSDGAMARQAGCTAVPLPLPPLAPEAATVNGERPFYSNTAWSTIQGTRRKGALVGGRAGLEPWERVGYDVFGPLFTGFLLWLATMVQRNQPDKILLFARDTHFINTYFPRFLRPLGMDIPLDYLYVSRRSMLLPSMTDFPLARLWHLFSGKSHRTVAEHLRNLGLSPELLSTVVKSTGFQSLDDIVPNGEPRMHALLTKLFQPLLYEGARQRPLVKEYLQSFVGDARRLMLVDIGWVGNMQGSFLRLLEPLTGNLQVRGYYVGLYDYARENDYAPHTMEGWLTHYGDPREVQKDVWWAGGTELLEFALCAPHGTTLGYSRAENGEIQPILEASDADAEARALGTRVQNGAGLFLEDYLDTYAGIPAAALASRVWGSEFYRMVTAPTPEEANLLGDLTHSDSAGDTRRRLPLAPRVPSSDLPAMLEAQERSFWKAGFRVRNGLTAQRGQGAS